MAGGSPGTGGIDTDQENGARSQTEGGVGELEGLASAEAFAGSTVSCPLWAGPQALSVRLAARHSPRAR